MSSLQLNVIDTSRFPLLFLDGASMAPGEGIQLIDDLETLIRNDRAFVLIIYNGRGPQGHKHDDDKVRMLWLKENKRRLSMVCKGVISVVPDQVRFAQTEQQTAGLRAALGIHFTAAENLAAAEALASNLLESKR